jgi:hypothetical protein
MNKKEAKQGETSIRHSDTCTDFKGDENRTNLGCAAVAFTRKQETTLSLH